MKRYTKSAIGVLIVFLLAGQLSAQQRNPALDSLLNEKDLVQLEKQLSMLVNSEKEKDINLASQYYARKNDASNFEKTTELAIKKFPLGSASFIKTANAILLEPDASKKEELLNAMVKKFQATQNYSMYYFDVANTYASDKKRKVEKEKVLKYADLITEKNVKYGYRRIIAESLLANGEIKFATEMVKQAMDSLSAEIGSAPATDASAGLQSQMRTPKTDYNSYKLLYAKILLRQGNQSEALTYAREVYNEAPGKTLELAEIYLNTLIANNELEEAYPIMEKMYRQGSILQDLKLKFKDAYIASKGSASGYDELLLSVKKELMDSAVAKAKKFAVNRFDAPTFTLKNMNGETVSLEKLKGKVVVLDFWATWCGPCKKSFPAMQLAVNKYKNDKDVVFLFIDTWERIPDPLASVKEYINDNKYTFNVLMDLKDPRTLKNNVIESYKVTGIPTKFVIDKNGKVAYRLTGFSGGDEASVEELSVMIEAAKS